MHIVSYIPFDVWHYGVSFGLYFLMFHSVNDWEHRAIALSKLSLGDAVGGILMAICYGIFYFFLYNKLS